MADNEPGLVLTIGHSTLPIETFIGLLKSNRAAIVLDIRTIPRSRHNPQFNKDSLPDELTKAGISYEHVPGLGGLRHPRADSLNSGWRNASFRGFADYMQTSEFNEQIKNLVVLASKKVPVLMCAEALPWRCHRSLIADALTVRGVKVEHILSKGKNLTHTLTPWSQARGEVITYPQTPAAGG